MTLFGRNKQIFGEDHCDHHFADHTSYREGSYEWGKKLYDLPLAKSEDLKVGDRVAWNVYGWHTGRVIGFIEVDQYVLDKIWHNKGDVIVLCDKPQIPGQQVVLEPGRSMRKI